MFFDNASTTKIDPNILDELNKINNDKFYNPGALYSKGREVKKSIEDCRKTILDCINAGENDNLIFTGSATEANNLALFGSLKKNTRKILISYGEHPSIYNSALEIKARGFNVEFIKLAPDGKVDIEDFKNKMTIDTDIVSIMNVSNETGAINDIAYLCEYAKSINSKCIFHSDGVQAVGKIEVDIDALGVDMYTMSAHKIHGMKGVGALYVKKGISLKPIIFGGGQEFGIRSGTENLFGILSLSSAVKIATRDLQQNYNHVKLLKEKFLDNMKSSQLDYRVNSDDCCSPYIVSISFKNCRAETLLNMLDDREIYVGNGSACSSKKSGNRILENMGIGDSEIRGNLRISFSKYNSIDEVEKMSQLLIGVVKEYLSKVN